MAGSTWDLIPSHNGKFGTKISKYPNHHKFFGSSNYRAIFKFSSLTMVDRFKVLINKEGLFSKAHHLLLATSGGLDSVVLCHLCHLSGFGFSIAHCNFQLRGEESERDERFVTELAKKYEVEIFTRKFDTAAYAEAEKISIQEAARDLRYAWFNELLETGTKPDYLLTGHHADDNAETMIMNFCRGTGLHGLSGIPMKAGKIRRPLLAFYRNELEQFAKENGLAFVEDSSNISSKYTRNLFRHEILPSIKKAYPSVVENLNDNAARFGAILSLYEHAVGQVISKLCKTKGVEVHIPIRQLMGFNNTALIFEIIRRYGFREKQLSEIIKLAESESGKFVNAASGAFRIIRHRHWFIISPSQSLMPDTLIIEEGTRDLPYNGGLLQVKIWRTKEGENFSSIARKGDNNIALLDMAAIEFPLLLRKWKMGDYFYPLGMKKKKKLSRFFIDQKLSLAEKERTWVIEMNRKIIWVVGHRIDDRFKITSSTREVFQLTSSPSS